MTSRYANRRRIGLLIGAVILGSSALLGLLLISGMPADLGAAPAETVTVYAVGDIAGEGTGAERVARMMALHRFTALLTLGDHAHEDGSAELFDALYQPAFGRFDERVRPVPGNHDYATPGAAGYFGYFGDHAPNFPDRPYYAYTLGAWRIYALNSEIGEGMPASAMYEWLRQELASDESACIAAYWHKPMYTVGAKANDEGDMALVWSLLAAHDADIVLAGHDHNYQRWQPIDGITSFVVGTGGGSRYPIERSDERLAFASDDTDGALELGLLDRGAQYAFRDVDDRVIDSGSLTCNDKGGEDAPRPAEPTELSSTATAEGLVLTWSTADGDPIGYVVYRGSQIIGFTTEPTFTDPDTSSSASVLYTVRAVSAGGARSRSSNPTHAGANLLGFTDYTWATEGDNPSTPTAHKPQSKLWQVDGVWWGILYVKANSDLAAGYYLHRFDVAAEAWTNSGVAADERDRSHADALWDADAGRLYVASTIRSGAAKLYRYSYSEGAFSLDDGYPVRLTEAGAESITIAKDADGVLWATLTQVPDGSAACAEGTNCAVRILHSTDRDYRWTAPVQLPTHGTLVRDDDISAVVAFDGGGQIGVVWSNQIDGSFQLAMHRTGTPDTSWITETIDVTPRQSNDHINLKADDASRLYVVVKTSLNDDANASGDSPLVLVWVREPDGRWRSGMVWTVADDVTRPQMVVDEAGGRILVVAAQPGNGGAIYYKTATIADLTFEAGPGTPIIATGEVNNPTTTKQTVDLADGVLILAGDPVSHAYWHARIILPPATQK
jgi:predicted phosphodiesterase